MKNWPHTVFLRVLKLVFLQANFYNGKIFFLMLKWLFSACLYGVRGKSEIRLCKRILDAQGTFVHKGWGTWAFFKQMLKLILFLFLIIIYKPLIWICCSIFKYFFQLFSIKCFKDLIEYVNSKRIDSIIVKGDISLNLITTMNSLHNLRKEEGKERRREREENEMFE